LIKCSPDFIKLYGNPKKSKKISKETKIITLKNILISQNGVIISDKCVYYNGGCLAPKISLKTALNKRRSILINNTVPKYKEVISISEWWGSGHWHFPIECLSALMSIKNLENITLHISKKNSFCLNWIKLIGIKTKEIIHGIIYTDKLILPEIGVCGGIYYNQLLWLKERLKKYLSNEFNTLVLIKRNINPSIKTNKRIVKNHQQVEHICKEFCKKRRLRFYLHDDINLPSLERQINIFSRAKIVIGPHGASAVNLLACKKGTFYIEFNTENKSMNNGCARNLASLLDLNNICLTYSDDGNCNGNVKINDIITAFRMIQKYI